MKIVFILINDLYVIFNAHFKNEICLFLSVSSIVRFVRKMFTYCEGNNRKNKILKYNLNLINFKTNTNYIYMLL